MNRKRSRSAPRLSFLIEDLESRAVPSGTNFAGALPASTVEIAVQSAKKEATKTTLTVSAGTLDQPITFSVTVRSSASAGAPEGTVNIVDHGKTIQTLTLSPTSTNGKFAFSGAASTLTPQPGGGAYFFGKHTVSAKFLPDGSFSKSSANKTFNVSKPAYTALSGGVKIATVAGGSGPEIQSGQTASVFYTGYLASNGRIFDDSSNDGGSPLAFTLGSGEVIAGFDEGAVGMQVGETRIIEIPPAEGYGHTANGPIPANSTLIFVLTLESIS
jgi:FKBP-type peptidyl-prolyl cis-trans isomerase FkpA